MKNFLENYGFAILSAIVVILLIAISTPVSNLIKSRTTNIVEGFANKTEAKMYSAFVNSNETNTYNNPEPVVNLISFTYFSDPYQAEEGMTWGEWVASEYNTGGFYISNDLVKPANASRLRITIEHTVFIISPTDVVIDGGTYDSPPGGGGQ